MAYNINNYSSMLNALKRWEERVGHEDRVVLANKIVRGNDCPCIVAAHLVGKEYGYDEPLNTWISHLEAFSSTNRIDGLKVDDEKN